MGQKNSLYSKEVQKGAWQKHVPYAIRVSILVTKQQGARHTRWWRLSSWGGPLCQSLETRSSWLHPFLQLPGQTPRASDPTMVSNKKKKKRINNKHQNQDTAEQPSKKNNSSMNACAKDLKQCITLQNDKFTCPLKNIKCTPYLLI